MEGKRGRHARVRATGLVNIPHINILPTFRHISLELRVRRARAPNREPRSRFNCNVVFSVYLRDLFHERAII